MFKYLRNFFYVFIWVVTLMSGPLSMLREVLAIFYPGKFPIADIYGHLVIIAFVASAFLLLMIKVHEVASLEKKLDKSKPNFDADLNVFAVAPAGVNNEDSILTIDAQITNTGAPSIVRHIEVRVKIDDRLVIGQPIPLDLRGSRYEGMIDGRQIAFVVPFNDHLVRKCSDQPIVMGGGAAGAHNVLLRGITSKEIYRAGTIIILSFEDVNRRKYEFKKIMTGQIIPPVNPLTLQKNINSTNSGESNSIEPPMF